MWTWSIWAASLLQMAGTSVVTDHLSEPGGDPDGLMAAFWNGTAHFERVSTFLIPITPTWNWGQDVGQQFVATNDGTWYMFHRKFNAGPFPTECPNKDNNPWNCGQVVRSSTDEGKSWSNYTVIAEPTNGRPDDCTLTDGGAYYDAQNMTWHYLSQCMGTTFSGWGMCHYSRKGQTPLGLFTPNPHNPVVRGGQLFGSICGGAGKHCPIGTHDEGTPQIVFKDLNGNFWVTFHGATPSNGGVRGVATTKDFVTWQTAGDGLPNDVIFSNTDCSKDRGWQYNGTAYSCCGGGEGSIIRSGYWMYHLIEVPQNGLSCGGYNPWPLALVRSQWFAPSGQWEQYPDLEPIVVPLNPTGCFIQYHRLFYDPFRRAIYVEYWTMADNGTMEVFKLVPGKGSLPIVAGRDLRSAQLP
mmetsp:Transcript_24196/g.63182  ORF Transcript_24196/g.63182 Transcript_24196/m.63182 type:complete len:410 (-) Transcript_24196:159-1388(-)